MKILLLMTLINLSSIQETGLSKISSNSSYILSLKIVKKKSNKIISIKAYRKSLKIKVRTIKLC